MEDLIEELHRVACDVAEAAGAFLVDGRPASLRVGTKSTATDMVTEMDHASEALIGRLLAERRPHDALVAEEGTDAVGSSGVRWIADPLDGTTNYLYGFPSYAVSLAAEVDGRIVAAAVRDAAHGETFSAALGMGAWCNGAPLARVEGPPTLATALVGTGFSYDPGRRAEQAGVLSGVLPRVRDIRRAGAAAVDLCWVGAGRLDCFYERGLAVWDWSGGGLVAREAGGRTDFLDDETYVAAPVHLWDELADLIVRSRGSGERSGP